ncbi:ATP-binding protein [Actinoplanes sp. CA-142083]|uniref:ATP-binding protein n=1 Tax=Actinoplanes sp. CA-142083 TaxID=3239903 RepID=UPI003D922005
MSIKLQLGLDVLRSYKRLPYSAWHALGEFVDNSTQSYFNNKAALDKVYKEEGTGLVVSIVYDREDDGLIRISDNAMGMSRDELARALRVGVPPEDPSGRSRYGLGMKMAACWYGNNWSIVTKKLGETVEFTVKVDVEAVAEGRDELEESHVSDLDPAAHYTRIEITRLNRKPQGRTLGKIKEFLTGMYRLDIDRKIMVLEWQNVALQWHIDWTFLKDSGGTEYRKDFEFTVDGKRVWGWTGVLDTGGRPKAGFAMIHQGRMVQTWPDAWHPESLYGQTQGSNDLVNQRLVGEIHLDEFEVSHTKDDIHWAGDEEDQVQDKLREICGEYRDVAKRTRKRKQLAQAAIQVAAKAVETELKSPEMADLIEDDLPSPEEIAADDQALLSETETSDADIVATLMFREREISVRGVLDSNKSHNDPYMVSESAQPDRVLVVINLNHPHVASIDENGLVNYFRHCIYDALAEWRARNQVAPLDPGTINRLKDGFLRLGFDIEMHDES